MVGDLANGRTVRSLCMLLTMYKGIKVYLVAPEVVKMRDDIKVWKVWGLGMTQGTGAASLAHVLSSQHLASNCSLLPAFGPHTCERNNYKAFVDATGPTYFMLRPRWHAHNRSTTCMLTVLAHSRLLPHTCLNVAGPAHCQGRRMGGGVGPAGGGGGR